MHILVYGAGAIGGYLGARLFDSGQQVTLLDRPSMAARIQSDGLTVEEAGSTIHVQPTAVSSLDDAFAAQGSYDLILMALKSYDLPAALAALSGRDVGATTILTVGNGIGIEEPFMAQFGDGRVIAGSLTTPVSKKGATHLVIERSDRGLALAPTSPGQDVKQWLAVFEEAGLNMTGVADYQSMKWSKAFLNIVSNASSAILDLPPGQIYANPDLFRMEVQMLRETMTVMHALDLAMIDLPGSPARTLSRAIRYVPTLVLKPILTRLVAGGRGDKMPSFYIDLVSGRGKSEVVYHNGAIADAGAAAGVAAPVNRVLNDVLLDLTTGQQPRGAFAGQPQRLLAEVAQEAARQRIS